jgi:hypothetical protein
MISATPSSVTSDYRKFKVWLLAMIATALGFFYTKGIIAFVLEKFYQFFIQNSLGSL